MRTHLVLTWTLAALAGCSSAGPSPTPSSPSPDASSRSLIQLRLVAQEAASGFESRDFEGETLYLEPEVVASDPVLSTPRLVSDDGKWTLDIRFTVDGGVELDRALLDRSGRRLALIVDSTVRRIVTARPQLGASRILIPLEISDDEAARLQEAIDIRWP